MFADVWITTGGTMYNALTEHIGRAVAAVHKNRSTDKKPVLIGFTNLEYIINCDDIRKHSHDITTADEQVRRRSVYRCESI